MGNFDAANVIQAAATSNLGVISLIVLALAFLAWRFFQRSADRVKLIAFGMMFLGAAGFVAAVMLAEGGESENSADPEPDAAPAAIQASVEADAASSGVEGVPIIEGSWHDSDGFNYAFLQDGAAFTYKVFVAGNQVGEGAGTMAGSHLTYRFVDSANGNRGTCEGDVRTPAETISGTCSDGSAEWDFAIER